MTKPKIAKTEENPDALFGRIVTILEEARGNVVRAVNTNMVMAYGLIGREIVEEVQGGEERAAYGKRVIEELSARLNARYGKGFSEENLQLFRRFYLVYIERFTISYPMGTEFGKVGKSYPTGTELLNTSIPGSEVQIQHPLGAISDSPVILSPSGIESGFSAQLSWSHYRALMRVDSVEARDFYEREAIAGGWDKRTLERQIKSFYYERLLKSSKPGSMVEGGRKLATAAPCSADELKNPYVLEFLGLPDAAELHESDVEKAIITHLQRFLLELGNGFAFVARQKHIRIGEQDRYIDLVFYHIRMRFHLLIDLKVGELTHGDIGQMDGYVRMYDDLFSVPEDNPTIGLILCTEKDETVARYSVLNDRKQIFASKYMLCLPTEEQLRLEIEKERHLIESALEDRAGE